MKTLMLALALALALFSNTVASIVNTNTTVDVTDRNARNDGYVAKNQNSEDSDSGNLGLLGLLGLIGLYPLFKRNRNTTTNTNI